MLPLLGGDNDGKTKNLATFLGMTDEVGASYDTAKVIHIGQCYIQGQPLVIRCNAIRHVPLSIVFFVLLYQIDIRLGWLFHEHYQTTPCSHNINDNT